MLRKLAGLLSGSPKPQTLTADVATLEHESAAFLIASETVAASELLKQHPPRTEHAKKRLLFELATSHTGSGSCTVSRYRQIPAPDTYRPFEPGTEITARKGYFRYGNTESAADWFMNFAHHDLFNGYGHFMFAQDEIQVAEHPVLASFREMMLTRTDGLRPATVEDGKPTPVLFRDVQRTVNIDTREIYGARFARANDETIKDAVELLEPPRTSNILAIEAPISSGNRIYSRGEIEAAFNTAYSGFRATILAATDFAAMEPVVIHTGNWGCGAYGGNRQLMLTIQMMAAQLAGVSRLIFYCGADGTDDVSAFQSELQRRFKFKPGVSVGKVIDRLVAAAFPWGTPDGN